MLIPDRDVDSRSSFCLPVTALDTIKVDGRQLLFSGTGSFLTIYDLLSKRRKVASKRIFTSQTIHGVVSSIAAPYGKEIRANVFVWGGRLLASCNLHIVTDSTEAGNHEIVIDRIWERSIDDWILDAKLLKPDHGLVLLTAHNALYKVPPADSPPGEPRLLIKGNQTLLYSGHLLVLSRDALLIASGSVFGEIVVWKCFGDEAGHAWSAQTTHIFSGHHGSIFGVALSEHIEVAGTSHRLLASCSDDRTIRVWDVSDCDLQTSQLRNIKHTMQQTGFGQSPTDEQCVGRAWAHLSRIWSVRFLQEGSFQDGGSIALLSRGEDGACHYWRLNKEQVFAENRSDTIELQQLYSDRHHTGKNVWSWADTILDGECLLLTGGADGQIIARTLQPPNHHKKVNKNNPLAFQDLQSCFADEGDRALFIESRGRNLRQYSMSNDGTLIATTDAGQLLKGDAHNLKSWTIIDPGKPDGIVVLSSRCFGHLTFFCRSNGEIAAFDTTSSMLLKTTARLPMMSGWMAVVNGAESSSSSATIVYIVAYIIGASRYVLLRLQRGETMFTHNEIQLRLPSDFMISSAEYNNLHGVLVCGSHQGAVAILKPVQDDPTVAETVLCVRHVHGSDRVTSITTIPSILSKQNSQQHFISTGRDGTYSIHRVEMDIEQNGIRLLTQHRSVPPLGPYIEGAYIRKRSDGDNSLIIYGFKSTEFIVWDETRQKMLFAVDCGGAHRGWTFEPNSIERKVCSFVWTRARKAHHQHDLLLEDLIIQTGGHGREIKAAAVSAATSRNGEAVIATGAEDTTIRLFSFRSKIEHEGQKEGFTCIGILRGHTTGLQHLQFSKCGKYLLSSAGCEEMYIWSISEVPLCRLGSVLVARLPKDEAGSDARIMSFDAIERSVEDVNDSLEIVMAYSTGKVKIVSYSKTNGDFTLVREDILGLICLTQAVTVKPNRIIVGATDGYIRIVGRTREEAIIWNHPCHQSSISAMAVCQIDADLMVVATGGDDNSLGCTVVGPTSRPLCKTSIVPSAHGAAVTALVIVDVATIGSSTTCIIASAGNDQKVKLWQVKVVSDNRKEDVHEHSQAGQPTPTMVMTKLGEYWTDVADISDICVVVRETIAIDEKILRKQSKLLVVGVGMQVLAVCTGQVPCEDKRL